MALGPSAVNATETQGTVRTANSVATIESQIAASSAGDTVVIAAGDYGYVTTTKNITSGFIRVIPETVGSVSVYGVDFTSAQGQDWRGINQATGGSYGTWFQSCSRIYWRGGTTSFGHAKVGFDFRQGATDIVVEDVTLEDCDVSFNFNSGTAYTNAPTNITIRRFLSQNVAQDHVFMSYAGGSGGGADVIIEDFVMFGHTDTTEHSDGLQSVGGQDVTMRRGHIYNTRAFRESATDLNDHGVILNYDTGDGTTRRPKRITLENLLIHDMTSSGISVAGCDTLTIRNCTSYDNGPGGTADGLVTDPDTGNTVTGVTVVNSVFDARTSSDTTYTLDSHNFVADSSGPSGTSRLTGDPGFTSGGYTLADGSQLIWSGLGSPYAPDTDIQGNSRGVTVSRGAFEVAATRGTASEVTGGGRSTPGPLAGATRGVS